jgi:Amt family ammonium transporter
LAGLPEQLLSFFKAIDIYSGLRVSEAEELHGLDRNEHGTSAYPDFWGVNEARDMLDLNTEQELTLLKEQTLKIDINNQ